MAKHSPSSISVPIEPDALRTDVAHAFAVVAERARELETTGKTVFDSMVDADFDDPGEELRGHAARVRCGARHAATMAIELEAMAGRLDGIALAKQLIEQALEGTAGAPEPRRRTRDARGR